MEIHIAGASWVLPVAFTVLVVSATLVLLRLLKGPTGPDRVVAIDALTLLGVAAVALGAVLTGQVVFLDVAVVLALVAFLGTVAFALLFRGGASGSEGGEDEGGEEADRRGLRGSLPSGGEGET